MSEFTTKEYRRYASQKFGKTHKQYKVYLENDVDKEVIAELEKSGNKTKLIRTALRYYIREMKKKQAEREAES